MLLTLVRHGEVDGRAQVLRGRSDDGLTVCGYQQLRTIVDDVQPAITSIASSPLQRCRGFAQTFSDEHQLPLHVINELREIDFGDWENLTLTEAQHHDPACFALFKNDTANWQPPHGEPYASFRTRVSAGLTQLKQLQTKHVLAITHGGVIRAILADSLQLSPASAALIGIPLAGMCQLWLNEDGTGSLLRLHWNNQQC